MGGHEDIVTFKTGSHCAPHTFYCRAQRAQRTLQLVIKSSVGPLQAG